jgi:hypothetical protein
MSGKRPSLADSMRAVAEAPEPMAATQPRLGSRHALEPIATASMSERATPQKRFYAATRAERRR